MVFVRVILKIGMEIDSINEEMFLLENVESDCCEKLKFCDDGTLFV